MKIDAFVGIPSNATSMAVTTFVGQNMGAKQYRRAERGMYVTLAMTAAVTVVMMIPISVFAGTMTALFNKDPQVLEYGIRFVRIMVPFYIFCCLFNTYAGTLRGAGDATAPMIITLFSFVAFRQVYLFVISRTVGTATAIALGYPAGWAMAAALFVIYYAVRGKRVMGHMGKMGGSSQKSQALEHN